MTQQTMVEKVEKTADDLLGYAADHGGVLEVGLNVAVVMQRSRGPDGKWGPDPKLPLRFRMAGRGWVDNKPVNCDVEFDLADAWAAFRLGQEEFGAAWTELMARALDARADELRRLADAYATKRSG